MFLYLFKPDEIVRVFYGFYVFYAVFVCLIVTVIKFLFYVLVLYFPEGFGLLHIPLGLV